VCAPIAEQSVSALSPVDDETSKYASLLATGERVLLVRQRHWLTFLEAGRWFVLALVAGIAVLLLDQVVPDDGIVGFLSTLLDWGFWIFLGIGLLGVGWYFLVWRVERYLVTTRRVIEAGGVINKYTRDTSLQAITDMIVGHPWLGRIVGYGEIDLLTASEAGTSKIRFLPDADGFKKALLDAKYEHELEVGGGRVLQETIDAASAPQPAHAQAAPQAPVGLSAEELDSSLSRLADLRDRGLITPEEFDEKKRELLDRL
jgi:Short C-terminal domain/Bacterial PH domain